MRGKPLSLLLLLLLLLLLTANWFIPGGSGLQCKTGQHNTVQYNTIQYNTITHHTHKITYNTQGNPQYPKLQQQKIQDTYYTLLRLRNE